MKLGPDLVGSNRIVLHLPRQAPHLAKVFTRRFDLAAQERVELLPRQVPRRAVSMLLLLLQLWTFAVGGLLKAVVDAVIVGHW